MRFFGIILAFWLLLLSCFPCSDRQQEYAHDDTAVVSNSTDQQQHEDGIEHCTPFCVCACCAVSTVSQEPVYYSFQRPLFGKATYTDYETPLFSNIAVSIWQPPRAC